MKIQKDCAPTEIGDLKFGHALLLFQEKWILFILHSLSGGPIGFNELTRRARQVNPTTLSDRLQTLEKCGLVKKTDFNTIPPKTSYELTDGGKALSTVFESIRNWSDTHGWTNDLLSKPKTK